MSDLLLDIDQAFERKIAALLAQAEMLRKKKAEYIAGLRADLGGQEIEPKVATKTHHPKKPTEDVETGPTTRNRGIQALDRMSPLGFGTAEWIKTIDSDGNPKPVNKNRALRIFKDLIDDEMIEVIKPHSGKQGGVYRKKPGLATTESPASLQ